MILKHDLHTTQGGVVLQQQQRPDTSALSGRDFQFSDPDASSSDTTESESERPIESRKMDSLMNDTESMFGLNCASCQIHKASLNQAKEQINNLVHKLGLAQNEILELQSTVNLLHKSQAKHTSSSISNRLSPFSWMKKEQQTHTDNNPNNSGSLPQVPVNLNAEQNIQEVKRLRNLVLQLESEKEALTLSTHALSQEVRALTIATGSKSTLPATTSVQISGHVTPHSTRSPPHEKQLVLSLKKATLIDFDDRDISPYSSQYTESSMGGMEISRSVSQLASARKQGGAYGNAMRLLRERDEKIRELTLELGNMYSLLATKDDELTALMAGVEVQEYKHTKSDGNSSLLFEKVWTPTASRAARRHSNFTTVPLDVMYSQEPSLCEQHALRDHHERVHPQIDDFVSRSQEQLEAMNETIVQNYSLLSTTLQDFGSVVAKSRDDESSTTLKQSECVSCHNEEFSERLEILQEENNFFAQMLGLLYQIQNRNIWNIVQEKEYRLMEYERLLKLVHEEKDRRNSIMGQVELFYYGVLHDTNIFIRKQLPKSDRKDLSLENVSKIQDENLRLLSELKPLKVQMVEYQALTDRLGVRYPFPSHYIGSAIVRLNSLQPC